MEGIPTLVILDAKTGAVINANGRGAIASDPEGVNFPWTPPAVAELSSSADGINETTSVCLMLEGCSAEVKAELGAALLEQDGADHRQADAHQGQGNASGDELFPPPAMPRDALAAAVCARVYDHHEHRPASEGAKGWHEHFLHVPPQLCTNVCRQRPSRLIDTVDQNDRSHSTSR